ncbi:MAG: hypothetical protein HYY18_12830 [Planctomycetes bacterium]|nr:hypothetical protein [Planctomycetota bacterium]
MHVDLVDTATGDVVETCSGHTYSVRDAEFGRDGRRFVTASQDTTAAVWDTEPGSELPRIPAPRDGDRVFELDAGRRLILFMPARTNRLAVADAATGATLRTLVEEGRRELRGLFLEDGNVAA